MNNEVLTLYKLILLYMLDCSSYPLTTSQVTAFVLEKEYTDYFTINQALGELIDDGFVEGRDLYQMQQLFLTEDGSNTLSYFYKQLPEAIQGEIKGYLKEHAVDLRKQISVLADYRKAAQGGYEVTLSAMERGEKLCGFTFYVPDSDTAQRICENWREKNEGIYEYLAKELF